MQKNINNTNLNCKICGDDFKSERGLHLHFSKMHNYSTKKYYEEFFPRKSLFSKKTIKFKNIEQYFNQYFLNSEELYDWIKSSRDSETKELLEKILTHRIQKKSIKNTLSSIELKLSDLPDIQTYNNFFGDYYKFCEQLGLNRSLDKNKPEGFLSEEHNPHLNPQEMHIFIDTREQKPIIFPNSDFMKLDFGDYTASGKYYDYTFVDRKSEQDFKSTFSGKNFERFQREMERAKNFNSYVFIVVESSIDKINKNNIFSPHKSKMPYIWHNVKKFCQDYRGSSQIVFAHNRSGLKKIIPEILLFGRKIWDVDVQYFIDKKINERTKERNLVS